MGHQLGRIQYPQINRTKDIKKKNVNVTKQCFSTLFGSDT